MTESRKVFYEIKKPPRKTYAVIVRELPTQSTGECQHCVPFYNQKQKPIGTMTCGEDFGDVYDCTCCGLDTCDDHMSSSTFHNEYLCDECAKLTRGEIELIVKLRTELNS